MEESDIDSMWKRSKTNPRPLDRTLLVVVLLCSTVATTIFTAISLGFDYKAESDEIAAQMNQIEVSLLEPIEDSLYYVDGKALEIQVSALLNMPSVISAKVTEADQNEMLNLSKAIDIPESFQSPTEFSKEFFLFDKDEKTKLIGTLAIKGTKYHMYKKLANKTLLFFGTQGIKTFIVSFILLYAFQVIVTRHLNKAAQFLSKFESSDDKKLENLNFGKNYIPLELETLEKVINILLDKVAKNNQKITSDLNKSKEELVKQKDIAKRTKELASLGEMAGGIAHEINNPLHIIAGNLEIISASLNDGHKLDRSLSNAQRSCDRISKITSSLLHFSREGDNFFAEQDVVKLFEGILVLTQIKAKAHHVEIDYSMDENIGQIFCNDIQIGQILINLFNNAIDYMDEAEIKEPWIFCKVSDYGDHVEFRVSNAGEKISTKIQEKIFEPFFTTKEVGKGTGLGLSISLGIIEKHRGKLFIDNQEQFTTFVFTVPKKSISEVG